MRERALVVGAVATGERVVELWDAMRSHFHAVGEGMEYVLHSTYDRLNEALLAGQVDVALNSPVAHLRVTRRTHGARVGLLVGDRDRDVRSVWITRSDSGIGAARDLVGPELAVGGRDHAFSRLAPLEALREEGIDLTSVHLTVFDQEPGQHGASHRDEFAIFAAVAEGRVPAGAVREVVWRQQDPERRLNVVARATPCDGWVFDALPTLPTALRSGFTRALGRLDPSDPLGARVLALLGARSFAPARENSYEVLRRAMDHQTAW